ncbi:MAG TPA: exodeoxyribonuclease VII large subunit [Fibrobacteraceae bacterium]|nr:exodeoxyribonuclease VII large subunit [Fibrobacteraceae bacterium]
MDSSPKSFPVSRYLQSVKRLVTEKIPPVWVHGVISQLTVRGRLCYLSLSEYAENDVRPIASLSLYLYAQELEAFNQRLARLPQPFALSTELKVSLLLQADFYIPQGKFQAKVLDIDPVHTLGELALTRQAILRRLEQEDLRERNRKLSMPLLPLRIGLVTAPGSAAYHDFVTTLATSGFAFEVIPAWARMQGNESEGTILEAMGNLLQAPNLDVLCIVRGGGSKTDLNYFDSEALCRAVALCPVPVLTGIGHEVDQSLMDLVAWKACITPTDCAKFIIACVEDAWTLAQERAQEIVRLARLRVERESGRILVAQQKLQRGLPGRITRELERENAFSRSLQKSLRLRLEQEQARQLRNRIGLRQGSSKILSMAKLSLRPWQDRISQTSTALLGQTSLRLDILGERIRAADPARILRQGYSIATGPDGKVLRSAAQTQVGMELRIRLARGEIHTQVLESRS